MSGYEYSDVLGSDDYEERQTGGALRKQLEQALGEIKSLRGEIQGLQRGTAAESLLKEKGINPQVAEAIPADVDPKEWIDKFGHLFGAGVNVEPEAPAPAVQEPDPALEEERAALEQVQAQSAGTGIPSTATQDQIEKLKSFQTEEELLRFIQSGGVG